MKSLCLFLPFIAFGQSEIEIQYVTSSVSFEQGAPVAGGLTTLFVRGLKFDGAVLKPENPPVFDLAGVRVKVYGRPAAILSMQNFDEGQAINVQVSWSADESVKPAVEVMQGDSKAEMETVSLGVWDTILTDDRGNALAYRLPSYEQITPENPLRGGDRFVIFGANMGPVTQAPPDGAVTPSNPPSLVIEQREPPFASVSSSILSESGVDIGLPTHSTMVPGLVGVYEIELNFSAETSPPFLRYETIQFLRRQCVDGSQNRRPPLCIYSDRYSKRVPIPVEPCDPKSPGCQPQE